MKRHIKRKHGASMMEEARLQRDTVEEILKLSFSKSTE